MLPTAILVLVGVIWAFGSVGMVGGALADLRTGGVLHLGTCFRALIWMLAAVIWIGSGIAIWKRMWWRGTLGAVVGYVLAGLAVNLTFP